MPGLAGVRAANLLELVVLAGDGVVPLFLVGRPVFRQFAVRCDAENESGQGGMSGADACHFARAWARERPKLRRNLPTSAAGIGQNHPKLRRTMNCLVTDTCYAQESNTNSCRAQFVPVPQRRIPGPFQIAVPALFFDIC